MKKREEMTWEKRDERAEERTHHHCLRNICLAVQNGSGIEQHFDEGRLALGKRPTEELGVAHSCVQAFDDERVLFSTSSL